LQYRQIDCLFAQDFFEYLSIPLIGALKTYLTKQYMYVLWRPANVDACDCSHYAPYQLVVLHVTVILDKLQPRPRGIKTHHTSRSLYLINAHALPKQADKLIRCMCISLS